MKHIYKDSEQITFYYFVENCYPYPIAHIYRSLRLTNDKLFKFNSYCFLFDTIIRYSTLILLSGYISAEEHRNHQTDIVIWQFLEEKNTPKSWIEMFKELLATYIFSGAEPVIPKLTSIYYDKKGNVNKTGRKLDRALFIRDQFGSMGCDSIKLADKYFSEMEEIIVFLLDRVQFLCDYPIIKPSKIEAYDDKFYFALNPYMGCDLIHEKQEAVSNDPVDEVLYIFIPEKNFLLELYPFFLLERCFCKGEHIFFFDFISREIINYLYYSDEHSISIRQVNQIDDLFGKGSRLRVKLLSKVNSIKKPPSGKTLFKNYHLLDSIGSGGMGQVYKTLQIDRGLMRAVKILPEYLSFDKKWIKGLEKEATKAAKVKHDNVVKMTAIGIFSGETFIVNEYVDSVNLRAYIDSKKKFTEDEVLRITMQICHGLMSIHKEDIVHRNLKPENILIYQNEKIKISDFGIMKAYDTQSDFIPGFPVKTAVYFSPEHFGTDSEIGYYSDIYSIGVILFELLTGELPYNFKSFSIAGIGRTILFSKMKSLKELRPDISVDMESLILNCLQKDPKKRYKDGEELFEDIELLLVHRGILLREEMEEYEERKKAEQKLREFLVSMYTKDIPEEERKEIISNMIKSFNLSSRKVEKIENEITTRIKAGELNLLLKTVSQVKDVAGADFKVDTIKELPPTITHPLDGSEMILIPECEFWMGSIDDKDPLARHFEKPGRKVSTGSYYIDKYPVTNQRFLKFIEISGYKVQTFTGAAWNWKRFFCPGKEEHPVTAVTWKDAEEYCKWSGKRLPTEAEWEKAARGTDGILFPWGNEWDKDKCNNLYTSRDKVEKKLKTGVKGKDFWFPPGVTPRDEELYLINGTLPVWSFPEGASPYGVMDMSGNVWEWCQDWYLDIYYSECFEPDPPGADSGEFKVLRGGSWYNAGKPYYFRNTFRSWHLPDYATYYWGFRTVLSVKKYVEMLKGKRK